MSGARKLTIVLAAPFTLAALLGGAVAFASQGGGGATSEPMGAPSGGYHRISLGDGAPDGNGCPHDKSGADSEAAVSSSVY